MKHIMTIMKKELIRVFKDKRLTFVIFVFPALMLYAMYSLMGDFMYKEPDSFVIESKYMPNEIMELINDTIENVQIKDIEDFEQSKINLKENMTDLIIVFDEQFLVNKEKNNVQIIYNPASTTSSSINTIIVSILDTYKKQLQYDKYGEDFEIFTIENILAADEEETIGQVYALILPFLIITFLFSGVTSVAPESIAGEKERGTITTLLVTPIKRSYIALGKIGALSILAMLSAISSFIGIIVSMPKLMGGLSEGISNIYGAGDYLMVFGVLIVTSLVLVGLVSILSCFAKNTKEASMYTMPLMLVSMGISMTSMLGVTVSNNILFAIPLFNSIQLLSEIFTFNVSIVHFIITIISNLLFTSLLVFVLTKMFDNEKIMFSK